MLAAIGLFFTYLRPGYEVLQAFQAQADRLDDSIERSKNLLETHKKLLDEYNRISPEKIAKLNKILPDSIDTVQFVLDIDKFATKYDLVIDGIDIPDPSKTAKSAVQKNVEESPIESIIYTVEFSGYYDDFKSFIRDAETSLSLMDVVALDIKVANINQVGAERKVIYKVGLQLYSLK